MGVPAEGLVIEAHMETGKGSVVGLLVDQGTISPGHFLVAGVTYAKVRMLLDYAGRTIKSAGPSTPVTITVLNRFHNLATYLQSSKMKKKPGLWLKRLRLNVSATLLVQT